MTKRVIKVTEWGEVDGSYGRPKGPHRTAAHAVLCASAEEAVTLMAQDRAKTIQECIFTLCPYCKASAETGQTTEHKCVAKPLFKLLYA